MTKPPQKAAPRYISAARKASNAFDRAVFYTAGAVVAVSILLELISRIAPYEYPFIGVAGIALLILIAAFGPARRAAKAQPETAPLPYRQLTAEEVKTRRHATITSHRFSPDERIRLDGFPVTSWQSAEHSVMMWMRHNGYSDATRTPPGPDGGVDVIATGAIAQVKYYATPIGEPAVVQLAGTTMKQEFQGRQALFFASNGYTPKALMTARDLSVALYELRGGRHWVRVR